MLAPEHYLARREDLAEDFVVGKKGELGGGGGGVGGVGGGGGGGLLD